MTITWLDVHFLKDGIAPSDIGAIPVIDDAVAGNLMTQKADGTLVDAGYAADTVVRSPRNYDADVSLEPGDTVELQVINMTNQDTTSGSQLYGLKIVTDTQSIDTAAGVAIFNVGKSDAVYINLSGKAGAGPYTDNSPTGVGIDLNKEIASSAQRSTSSNQQGIQIFDWSTTNQGPGGPRGMLLLKIGNMNTDHILQSLKANVNALQIIFDSDDAGYDATKPLVTVNDEADGQAKWRIRANGDQVFDGDGLGVQWEMASGNPAYMLRSGTDELKIRSGTGGLRIVNNTDTGSTAVFENNGNIIVGTGDIAFANSSKGVILIDRTKGDPYRLFVDNGELGIEG